MDESLRLFIAIDLPDEVKALLRELQTTLGRATQAVRWSDPNGTHLTLKFLGNTPASAVDQIVSGMQQATGDVQAFQLQTAGLGVFPNPKRPRVVWLGVEGDITRLNQLHTQIEQHVAPLGFPTEQRAFSPHLTLGRSHKDPRPAEQAQIGQAVTGAAAPRRVEFAVREVVLMRSELRPSGARYTPVAHVPLDH